MTGGSTVFRIFGLRDPDAAGTSGPPETTVLIAMVALILLAPNLLMQLLPGLLVVMIGQGLWDFGFLAFWFLVFGVGFGFWFGLGFWCWFWFWFCFVLFYMFVSSLGMMRMFDDV